MSTPSCFCQTERLTSLRSGSNEGSQHMFSLRNKKNFICIILNTPSDIQSSEATRQNRRLGDKLRPEIKKATS